MIKLNIKHIDFYKILFSTTILYVIFYLLYPCLYDGWDDSILTLISSGYFNIDSKPDFHLIFINTIIGQFLSFLYSLNKNIEWYFLHLFILQIISTSTIYYILSLRFKTFLSKVFLAILLFSFSSMFLMKMQFTTTAYMLCASGYILLLHTLDNKFNLKSFKLLSSIFLIVYSYLIRPEVVFSTTALFVPVFLLHRNLRILVPIVLTILGIIIFSNFVNNSSYKSTQWKEYKQYNKFRGNFNRYDTPLIIEFNKNTYTNNISIDEFDLYDIGLPTRSINANVIKDLISIYNKNISNYKKLFLIHIYYNLKGYFMEFAIISIFLVSLLYKFLSRKIEQENIIYILILTILSFSTLFIYLCIFKIPKGRVFYGLFFALLIIIIYYNHLFSKYIFFLPFLLIIVPRIIAVEKNFKIQNELSKKAINFISKLDKDLVFINNGGSISGHIANLPPHNISKIINNHNIIINTWLLNSPIYKQQFEKYIGMDIEMQSSYQLFKKAMLNDKVFYILEDKYIDLIRRYYYNNNVQIQTKVSNNKIPIIGFRKNDTIQ